MDFNAYTIYQSIGNKENRSERKIGLNDLVCALLGEGFSNFATRYGFSKSYGFDVNGFKDQIASAVLGIPRDALVKVESLGKRGLVIVHFEY